jgi:hypothetical protein
MQPGPQAGRFFFALPGPAFGRIQQVRNGVGPDPPHSASDAGKRVTKDQESLDWRGFRAWHAFCSYPGERQSIALLTNH